MDLPDLAVKEFFELLNIGIYLVGRYEENPSKLQGQYGSFMQLREEGLPTRADLEVWQSQAFIRSKTSSYLKDKIMEIIADIPQEEGEGAETKKTKEGIDLEMIFELAGSYFEEAGEYIRRDADTKSTPLECAGVAGYFFEKTSLSIGQRKFLAYAKERILDFITERDSYYAGQGLYILQDFNDFLRRGNQETN